MAKLENKHLCFTQIAKGDKEAFDVFFQHYYPRLLQFARFYVHCSQQAEDVVSEVLTNMLIHRARVFALEHFESYLYASVKNKAQTAIKKQGKTEPYPVEDGDFKHRAKASSNPLELLVEQELRSRIQSIIHNFPPKRKMVFQLIREEGLSYREVAHLMDISERTVEVHLKLAVKSLREGVEHYLGGKKCKTTRRVGSNVL